MAGKPKKRTPKDQSGKKRKVAVKRPVRASAEMKAVQIQSFGGPEKLHLVKVPRPLIKDDEVLVKIHDAGVNPVDWKIREGQLKGSKPSKFPRIMGQDFSGEVIARGKNVTAFHLGDRVFGFAGGSYAEYAAIPSSKLARIPAGMDFTTAAALPTSGLTAYQILMEVVRPRQGETVLIHGAAGGVGSIAVQIAKYLGAAVIANAAAEDSQYLQNIGADRVVDYKSERFDEVLRNVDAIIDLVGGDVCERSYGVLKRGGILVSTVGATSEHKGSEFGIRAVNFVMKPDAVGLGELARLVELGIIKPRMDKVMPFSHARKAQELNQKGRSQGKVILEIVRGEPQA